MSKESDPEKLSKEEKKYLNSKARFAQGVLIAILEFILVFLLSIALTSYATDGNLDNFMNDLTHFTDWLQPGGVIYNALIGVIPLIMLECIGQYFGSGTVGKMVIGVGKCLSICFLLYMIVNGVGSTVDLPMTVSNGDVESITIGLDGLARFVTLIMLILLIVPIGEYLGGRKKHKEAYEKWTYLKNKD